MTSAQRVGSLFITGHPTDPIEIDCQKCGCKGRYRKASVPIRFPDMNLL